MSAAKITDKKLLSVFTTRFIPSWWQTKYPKFTEFFQGCLEWMEQDEHTYENIANFDKYFDIDKIADLKNSADPVKQELGNKLIDQVYLQYLGDSNLRYISEYLDEVLYIKNQKNIIGYKGTKYSYMFMFLLILGGFFRIYDLVALEKLHDGRYMYNGLIRYGTSSASWVEPFVYLIRSEYAPTTYQKVLKILNPAGMYPYAIQSFTTRSTSADTVAQAELYGDTYMAIYKDATLVAVFSCIAKPSMQIYTTGYDVELSDYTLWKYYDNFDSGVNSVFYETNFNTRFFTGEYNNVYIYKDVIYSGSPADQLYYTTAPDSFTDLTGAIDVKHTDGSNFEVVDYSSIGIMATYV